MKIMTKNILRFTVLILLLLIGGCSSVKWYTVEHDIDLHKIKVKRYKYSKIEIGRTKFVFFDTFDTKEMCLLYENKDGLYKILHTSLNNYTLLGVTKKYLDSNKYKTKEEIVTKYNLKEVETINTNNDCTAFSKINNYYIKIFNNENNPNLYYYVEYTNNKSIYSKNKRIQEKKIKEHIAIQKKKERIALQKRNDKLEKINIIEKTKGMSNQNWRFDHNKYTYKDNNGKCLYAVPVQLLNNPNIFSHPIEKKDIVNITFSKSWAINYKCNQGFLERNEKKDNSKNVYMEIQSKNPSLKIRVIGEMKKGMFVGDIDLEIYKDRDEYKSYLSNKLKNNKDVKIVWGSTYGRGYVERLIFADGKNNFYLGKKNFIKNGLTTKNKIKDAIAINLKLSSGKYHNVDLDDTSLLSEFEAKRKNLYLKYLVKPKNKSQLIGKDFKVTLVLDFKLNYNTKSNMSLMGISPVIGKSTKFYKEINFILMEKNNWTISGKELLKEVEVGSAGKALGVRLKTWFTGISDRKIYIKNIKEI